MPLSDDLLDLVASLDRIQGDDRGSREKIAALRRVAASDARLKDHLQSPAIATDPAVHDEDIQSHIAQQLTEAAKADSGLTLQRRVVGAPQPDVLEGSKLIGRLGPFLENGADEVWFDVFLPEARVSVFVNGEATPVIVFGAARLPRLPKRSARYRFHAGRGTVYVRLDAFIPGAAADSYAALEADSAEYASGLPSVSGTGTDRWLNDAALEDIVIKILLSAPAGPSALCTGVAVEPPKALRLRISAGVMTFELDGGTGTIPDHPPFVFEKSTAARMLRDRLLFDAKVAPEKLALDALASPFAKMTGSLEIGAAGWSLPVGLLGQTPQGSAAESAPGWLLELAGPFDGEWTLLGARRWSGEDGLLLIAPSAFRLSATLRLTEDDDRQLPFGLWSLAGSGKPLSLVVTVDAEARFALGCAPEVEGRFLEFGGGIVPVLGLPFAATGVPIPLPAAPVVVTLSGDVDFPSVVLAAAPVAPEGKAMPMVMENAVLMVKNAQLRRITARLGTGFRLHEGVAAISLDVASWVPSLPDPYVSNLSLDPAPEIDRARMPVAALVRWSNDTPLMELRGTLGTVVAPRAAETPFATQPTPHQQGVAPESSAMTSGRVIVGSDRLTPRAKELDTQRRTFEASDARGAVAPPMLRLPAQSLLDVSTRIHQIGISLASGFRNPREPQGNAAAFQPALMVAAGGAATLSADNPQAADDFRLSGMSIVTALDRVEVFALPQIQWEPVRTLDKDQNPDVGWFPPELGSPHDGGPTRIVSRAGRLVAVVPDIALEAAVKAFSAEKQAMIVATTLPFGIVSGLLLQPEDTGPRKRDEAVFVAPHFATRPALSGGLQLSLRAESGFRRIGEEDPSFAGMAVQTKNGVILATGQSAGLSVLGSTADPAGSVERFFNENFAGTRPRAPITRLDLSGYGASTFSDWNDPIAAFGEAAKVQFSVIVGRTSYEFVKIISKLYPWGITVTRSVTVERRGGGGVIRRDSGWQAGSPGLFDYPFRPGAALPVTRPNYVFEPGLIRGIFDITRIRPAPVNGPAEITLPGGGKVLPMYIDAKVQVDGAAGPCVAQALLSFLHIAPLGVPITRSDLADLVERHGNSIGGRADGQVELGGSGFSGRVVGLDVSVARDGGTPVFVGAVRVAPAFPTVGAWALVRGPSDGTADMAGVGLGAPVIRSGITGIPVNDALTFLTPRGRLRIADAADMYAVPPANDYGLMQSTPTHRFVFRRPEIVPGAREIVSAVAPALVDVMASTLAKGFFPPVANAIQFPNAGFVLQIPAGTNGFRLTPDYAATAPRGDLVMDESAVGKTRLDYGGATVSFTLSETRWAFDLQRLAMRADVGGTADMLGSKMRVIGASDERPQLRDMAVTYAPAIEAILSVLPGFGSRDPFRPIDLAPTNLELATKIAIVKTKEFSTPADLPVVGAVELKAKLDLSIETKDVSTGGAIAGVVVGVLTGSPWAAGTVAVVGSGIDKAALGLKGSIKATIKVLPPPITPFFFLVGAEVAVGMKVAFEGDGSGSVDTKFEVSLETTIFIGFGVGKTIAGFEAEAWLGIGYRAVLTGGSTSEALSGGVMIFEAGIDLKIAKVEVAAEYVFLRGVKDGVQIAKYTGELTLSVSFGWIFKIEFSTEVSGEDGI